MKLPPLLDLVTRRFEGTITYSSTAEGLQPLRIALLPLYLVGFVAVMETC